MKKDNLEVLNKKYRQNVRQSKDSESNDMYIRFIDDILKSIGHTSDKRSACDDSEILTTALVAALHYGGNHADAIGFVKETGLMPHMISESCYLTQFNEYSPFKAFFFLFSTNIAGLKTFNL